MCSPIAQSLNVSPILPMWKLDTTDIFAWLNALNGCSLLTNKKKKFRNCQSIPVLQENIRPFHSFFFVTYRPIALAISSSVTWSPQSMVSTFSPTFSRDTCREHIICMLSCDISRELSGSISGKAGGTSDGPES